MTVSPSYRAYVLEQLQVIGTVTAKAMFGGVGLYCRSLFFGLIADDTLYLKVDDGNRGDYERVGASPFRPYGDASYSMHYYELPAEVLEDRSELRLWAEKSVAAARRKSVGRRRRPRG
ncbi:MAG: TfoX/Sxy family protein [Gemmatimonadales bacterium]